MLNYKILRDHTSEVIRVNIYNGSLDEVTELQNMNYEIVNKREEQSRTTYYLRLIKVDAENE